MGMRNMAKKRGPVDVVAVAMALPMTATTMRPMMCRERSPVLEDDQVTTTETRNVANYVIQSQHSVVRKPDDMCERGKRTQTGAVSQRVSIFP